MKKPTFATCVFSHLFDGKNKCKMTVENWPDATAWEDFAGDRGPILDQAARYATGIKRSQKARDQGLAKCELDLMEFELLKERGMPLPMEKRPVGALTDEELEEMYLKRKAAKEAAEAKPAE